MDENGEEVVYAETPVRRKVGVRLAAAILLGTVTWMIFRPVHKSPVAAATVFSLPQQQSRALLIRDGATL